MYLKLSKGGCWHTRCFYGEDKKTIPFGEGQNTRGSMRGIGEYFDIDPTLVRLIFILLGLNGMGVLAYLIAWVVIPRNPNHKW